MKNIISEVTMGQAILTGLLLGMAATLVCFGFNIYYRMQTMYGPTEFINVSTITFITNLLLMIAGVIYFAFKKWFKKGDLLFVCFFILLTLFCIWQAAYIHRFSDQRLNHEFIYLLSGTLGIIGVFSLCIPLLINNKKILDSYYEADI